MNARNLAIMSSVFRTKDDKAVVNYMARYHFAIKSGVTGRRSPKIYVNYNMDFVIAEGITNTNLKFNSIKPFKYGQIR